MIKTIAVCGAGTMGSGIAQVAAQSGFQTILFERDQPTLDRAKAAIKKNLAVLVERKKLTEQAREQIETNLRFTNDINECRGDVIIEAIIEKQEAKIDLFNSLAGINDENTLFASNTSSLSLEAIARNIHHPGRLIGMHFFNPAPLMKLVEVITTSFTTEAVRQVIMGLAIKMQKTPVVCKDSPGFIVNRVARPYYIEALRLAEESLTSIEQADLLLEATGFRMGPFKLMDLIGNDINYAVSCSVYEQLGMPERLRPSSLQQERVERGELGKKTGKGYYDYS